VGEPTAEAPKDTRCCTSRSCTAWSSSSKCPYCYWCGQSCTSSCDRYHTTRTDSHRCVRSTCSSIYDCITAGYAEVAATLRRLADWNTEAFRRHLQPAPYISGIPVTRVGAHLPMQPQLGQGHQLFPEVEQKEEGDVLASPQSTLSAIGHQETRNTPRRIIGQIVYTNNSVTEARAL
jgi:hypothetical protein